MDDDRKRALDVAAASDAPGPLACFVCGDAGVKYRCPRCERVTCSLECCLKHKKEVRFATSKCLRFQSPVVLTQLVRTARVRRQARPHQVRPGKGLYGRRSLEWCVGPACTLWWRATSFSCGGAACADFFFLEEVSRSTNSASRSRNQLGVNVRRYGPRGSAASANAKKRRVSGPSVNPDLPSDWLTRFPVATQLLAEHAAKRGVALTLLAPGMSKRARNSSYMDIKKKTLFWRIEWDFPFADVAPNLVEARADDSQTLFALLSQYFTKSPVRRADLCSASSRWSSDVVHFLIRLEQENVTIRSKLKRYAVAEWEHHVTLLLRKEFVPASQPQYYRLDGSASVESNLKRKAIVEFPIITVVPNSEVNRYPVAFDAIEVVSEADGANDSVEDETPVSAAPSEDASADCESVEMSDSVGIDEESNQTLGGEGSGLEGAVEDKLMEPVAAL